MAGASGRRGTAGRVDSLRPFPPPRGARGAPAHRHEEGLMSFAHAWLVPLTLAPIAWAAWEWRSTASRAGLVMKAVMLAAIMLALAEPRMTFYESQAPPWLSWWTPRPASRVRIWTPRPLRPLPWSAGAAVTGPKCCPSPARRAILRPPSALPRLGNWHTRPDRIRTARIWKPPCAKAWPRCPPGWCRACF